MNLAKMFKCNLQVIIITGNGIVAGKIFHHEKTLKKIHREKIIENNKKIIESNRKEWKINMFPFFFFAQNLNMKNHNTILLVTLLLIVVAVVVIVFVTRKRKKSNKNNSDPAGNSNTSPNMDTSTTNATFSHDIIMKQGSRGEKVKVLQRYFNEIYNAGLTVDGIWGSKTQKAVEKFEPEWKAGLTQLQYEAVYCEIVLGY